MDIKHDSENDSKLASEGGVSQSGDAVSRNQTPKEGDREDNDAGSSNEGTGVVLSLKNLLTISALLVSIGALIISGLSYMASQTEKRVAAGDLVDEAWKILAPRSPNTAKRPIWFSRSHWI